MSDNELFESIKTGRVESIEHLYVKYRSTFLHWANKHFGANNPDIEDSWQEAVIAFFEQVKSGKLTTPPANLKTYLFAIGKHKLLNVYRESKNIELRTSFDHEMEDDFDRITHEESAWEQKLNGVQTAFAELSQKCREHLIKRYYLRHTLEEIQQSENLASVNVVSASISRCLKGLKQLIRLKSQIRVL